jgi:predicted Mrr-cat superfamily restriction endonuclease
LYTILLAKTVLKDELDEDKANNLESTYTISLALRWTAPGKTILTDEFNVKNDLIVSATVTKFKVLSSNGGRLIVTPLDILSLISILGLNLLDR